MTDERITQARLIESAQRRLKDQLVHIAREMVWYRKYPQVYSVVILELRRQQADITERFQRLQEQMAATWTR